MYKVRQKYADRIFYKYIPSEGQDANSPLLDYLKKSVTEWKLANPTADPLVSNECPRFWVVQTDGSKRSYFVVSRNEMWDIIKIYPHVYESFIFDVPMRFVFDLDIQIDMDNYKWIVNFIKELIVASWNSLW